MLTSFLKYLSRYKIKITQEIFLLKNNLCLKIIPLLIDYKYEQTEITLSCGGEFFAITSNREVSKGFALALTNVGVEESTLPDVKKGDTLPVGNSSIEQRQTGPPDYLSESDLITLMEKHGIGTDASIPVHINNIVQRNYVQLGK